MNRTAQLKFQGENSAGISSRARPAPRPRRNPHGQFLDDRKLGAQHAMLPTAMAHSRAMRHLAIIRVVKTPMDRVPAVDVPRDAKSALAALYWAAVQAVAPGKALRVALERLPIEDRGRRVWVIAIGKA